MNLKELKKVADTDSVKCSLQYFPYSDEDNGIVALNFAVKDIRFTAQYSPDIKGIYAFSISDSDSAEKMFNMLK